MSHTLSRVLAGATLSLLFSAAIIAASRQQPTPTAPPSSFGIGRIATAEEIAARDIDIGPDGRGLPPGRGTAAEGGALYAARCASCHGKNGTEGPNDVLVGRIPGEAFPFSKDATVPRTIGNYWPYATTLFDYIRRAMPPNSPGSLSDNEVYALVAHLLAWNRLIAPDAVLDAQSLPKVQMPAQKRFVPDSRPGAGGARPPKPR